MQSDTFFDERASDKEVIRNLLRHIHKLNEEKSMPVFRDSDGSVKIVVEVATVTREVLAEAVASAQANLDAFDALVAAEEAQKTSDLPEAPTPEANDEIAAPEVPVTPAFAAEPELPAASAEAEQAPAAEVATPELAAPVEQPVIAPAEEPESADNQITIQ